MRAKLLSKEKACAARMILKLPNWNAAVRKPPAGPDKNDDAVPHRRAVVVVDRNLLFRAGLIHALDHSRFDVLAESSSLEDVPFGRLTVGQAILLLIGLESARTGTVLPALRDWRRRYNDLTVIILSDHNWTESLPSDRAEIGDVVDALLPNESVSSESISHAVDLVLLGMSVMPQEFLRHAGFNGAAATALAPRKQEMIAGSGSVHLSIDTEQCAAVSLTVREKLILSHLTNGDSNKHIARAIGIAEPTVKIHVRNLMRKTDTRNRTQAAMWGKKIALIQFQADGQLCHSRVWPVLQFWAIGAPGSNSQVGAITDTLPRAVLRSGARLASCFCRADLAGAPTQP